MINSFIGNLCLNNSPFKACYLLLYFISSQIPSWLKYGGIFHFAICFCQRLFLLGIYEVHGSHLPGYSGVRTWQPTAGVKVMSGTFTTEGSCLSSLILRSSLRLLEQCCNLNLWEWTGCIRPAKCQLIFSSAGVLFFKSNFFPKLAWLDSINNIKLNWFLGTCPN